jgi:DUF296 family protein family protein
LTGRYDGKIPTLVRHDYESKLLLQSAERSTTCAGHVYNDRRLQRGDARGHFDWEKKGYERIAVREQVEVLAFVGDIALQDGKPNLHAHVVLGGRDGNARGGHLLSARVRPTTLEVIVTERRRT